MEIQELKNLIDNLSNKEKGELVHYIVSNTEQLQRKDIWLIRRVMDAFPDFSFGFRRVITNDEEEQFFRYVETLGFIWVDY